MKLLSRRGNPLFMGFLPFLNFCAFFIRTYSGQDFIDDFAEFHVIP
jgi:hypothetical protein